MSLKHLGLNFSPSPRWALRHFLFLALLFLITVLTAINYLDIRQTVAVRRAEIKQREASASVVIEAPRRSSDDTKLLQQEVQSVNRQIRQLNQHWDILLNDLRVYPGGIINPLSLEVNALSRTVRFIVIAPDIETMTDYAAYLTDKKSLDSVLISRHEIDISGLRFVVEAKWSERH